MSKIARSHAERIGESYIVDPSTGCWLWSKALVGGYGVMSVGKRPLKKQAKAHRMSYEAFVGPIPKGLQIDHLCFRPSCVNPKHLEVVTGEENLARRRSILRPKCIQGHEFTKENTYLRPEGRYCRTCRRENNRKAQAKKRLLR